MNDKEIEKTSKSGDHEQRYLLGENQMPIFTKIFDILQGVVTLYDFIECLVDGTFILRSCLERRLLLHFHKRFAMITFLSLNCFTAFFSTELLVRYKIYPSETGDQRGKSTYALGRGGFVISVHVRTMGGVRFSPFWRVYMKQMAP